MRVIPAVDIRKGKCVQLVGGDPDTEQDYGDPLEAALEWREKGAERIHVIDLDAAMDEGENLEYIRKIVKNSDLEVQVGGGVRSVEKVENLLNFGVDDVIIGTTAFRSPDVFERILESVEGKNIFVALDAKGGKVVVKGWKESTEKGVLETAKELEDKGVGGFLFTNVDVEGRLEGLDAKMVKNLVQTVDIPVFAAGGVKSIKDIKKAKKAGASGVIVGTAIYEGKLSLEEALEVVKNEEK